MKKIKFLASVFVAFLFIIISDASNAQPRNFRNQNSRNPQCGTPTSCSRQTPRCNHRRCEVRRGQMCRRKNFMLNQRRGRYGNGIVMRRPRIQTQFEWVIKPNR